MTPAQLAALHAAAFKDTRPWSADEFASLLASPHVFLCTTKHAFALGRAVVGEAEMLTLATDPAHQRQGHARRALELFHAEAAKRAAETALLEVDALNHAACALYASFGYAETQRRSGYYRHADDSRSDALILSRALPYS